MVIHFTTDLFLESVSKYGRGRPQDLTLRGLPSTPVIKLMANSRKRSMLFSARKGKRTKLWGRSEAKRMANRNSQRNAVKAWRSALRARKAARESGVSRPVRSGRRGYSYASKDAEGTKSFSMLKRVNKREGLKFLLKNAQKYQVEKNEDQLTTSDKAKQGVMTLAYLHTQSDLTSIIGAMGISQTGDLFLGHAEATVEIKNQTNIGCRLWLYDVFCKISLVNYPENEWSNALTDLGSVWLLLMGCIVTGKQIGRAHV